MSDLTILLPPSVRANLSSFLSVADGVRRVEHLQLPDMVPYEDGALIPASDWRPVEKERALPISDQRNGDSPFVAMLNFEDLVNPLWSLGCLQESNLIDVRRNPAIELWYETLLWPAIVERWGEVELRYNGANDNKPNQLTTTINYRTDKALGLHLDTWEVVSIKRRRESLYRLCLNIGRVDRYFIFGIRPTDLFMTDEHEKYYYEGKLRYSYTDQLRDRAPHLSMPLCRLRVPPGHAYLAPTDLLIHDASTIGIAQHGASFAVRGAFQFSKLNWWAKDWTPTG